VRPEIYLDTDVFIYAFEGDPDEVQYLLAFFEFLQLHEDIAMTSELTLAELFASTRKHHQTSRTVYENLLIGEEFIELRPITRSILIETADLRRRLRLKLPDAIHVVTAVQGKCRYFLSADRDSRRLPDPMIHIRPDAKGIRGLMESLRA
jgi:predicted nucleic acid-binding protein